MVAGTLNKAGYFMGTQLIPARSSNPKGFFEDRIVNDINETILQRVLPERPRLIGPILFRHRPAPGQRWLARLPLGVHVDCDESIAVRISDVVEHEPFCLKDPRFCYTLEAWQPFLNNAVFVCVFRDPGSTARSILKERQTAPYLKTLRITFDHAVDVWTHMYRWVLNVQSRRGSWLFLHYNQLFDDVKLAELEEFVEAPVDVSFPDRALRRPSSAEPVCQEADTLYRELCTVAGFDAHD